MRIQNHGSVVLLFPESDAERDWVDTNVDVPDWAWTGDGFACEPRCVQHLLDGLASEVA